MDAGIRRMCGVSALAVAGAVAASAFASSPGACPEGWTQPMPARRLAGCVMVFDPVQQRVLLIGGTSDRTSRELWAWDGAAWQAIERNGPSIMAFGAAYHAGSGRVIVFGGGVPTALLPNNETWSWDGTTWEQHTFGVPPSARNDAALAPDPSSGSILLFGGLGNVNGQLTPKGDTWVWDGIEWSQVIGAGPAARTDHAMATDTLRQRVVMFGGDDGVAPRDDTWEWDGSQWQQRMAAGPSARKQHRMTYDVARGVTVLAGGIDAQGQVLSDTWEWNGTAWTQRAVTGLPAVRQVSMAYDAVRQKCVLLAGTFPAASPSAPAAAVLLEYDGSAWTAIQHEQPLPRLHASMTFDRLHDEGVLFGGAAVSGPDARTWAWDGADWRVAATTGPAARQRHAMTWDSSSNLVLMFGGLTHNGRIALGDTWTWNGASWSLAAGAGPTPRGEHVLAYDETRHVAVLFGGVNADGDVLFGDTWEWNGATWVQRVVAGPSARRSARAAWDASRQAIVLHGGIGAGGALSDTWVWDGTTWSSIALTGGPPPTLEVLAYDLDLGGLVGVGAASANQPSQAWSLVGNQWRLCAQGGPLAVAGAAAYDAERQELVYVTGTALITEPTETWRLGIAVAADCNGDRQVNGADLAVLLAQFGQSVAPGVAADVNGDGLVNGADLSALLSSFGANCPVTG